MAQTGFTPIQLYYSTASTNVPLLANLQVGELAINVTDKKLFTRNGASTVIEMVPSPTNALAVNSGGTGATSASSARTNLGATTVGSNLFTATNPSAVTYFRVNADNTVSLLDDSAFRTAIGATTVGGNFFTLANPSAIRFIQINADNTVSALDATAFRSAIGAGSGGGDFSGPASAVSGNFVSFNGTTGKLGQDSGKAAPSGAIVGTSDSQTLTNKTISAGVFTDGYTEEFFTANTGTSYTIDLANGTVQKLTLTGNCTFTFPTATAGKSFMMLLTQDGTGSRTVTWPTGTNRVRWPASTAPTITATAGRCDKYIFTADGTQWLGSNGGQNYTLT